jgi:hypothetical protein
VIVRLVLLALLLVPAAAHACTCTQRPLEENYAGADVVFAGRIVANEFPGPPQETWRVTVRVTEVWRGDCVSPEADGLVILESYDGATCGLADQFSVGEDWVLFCELRDGVLWASGICWGSWEQPVPDSMAAYLDTQRDQAGLPELLDGSAAAIRGIVEGTTEFADWIAYQVNPLEVFRGPVQVDEPIQVYVARNEPRLELDRLKQYLFFLDQNDGYVARPCGALPLEENWDTLDWLRAVTPVEATTWGRIKATYRIPDR